MDPDGEDIVVGTWFGRLLAKFGVNNFEAKTQNRLQSLKTVSPELNNAITTMESNPDVTVHVFPTEKFSKDYPNEAAKSDSWKMGVTVKDGSNSSIYYHEDAGFLIDDDYSSADAILAHKLGHAENNMNGTSVEYNREEARKPNGNIVE